MREIIDEKFNKAIGNYPDCCIHYCLLSDGQGDGLQDDQTQFGMEARQPDGNLDSHRRALMFALENGPASKHGPWNSDISKARAKAVTPEELLALPAENWKQQTGNTVCFDSPNVEGKIPYCYAFLEPPHGTEYTVEDFRAINEALFPNGTDQLEIYDWTTDWSDYFDAGLEWWGTCCWSIYDAGLQRYTVITASTTD